MIIRMTGFAFTAALLLGAGSLRAQQVRTDYDRDVDFTHYHTFSIYKVHSYNTIEENRLRGDLVDSLQRHGLQMVQDGGDLAVTAIGNVHDQQEYSTFYNGFGGGYGYRRFGFGGSGFSTTQAVTIPVGTLAVDLYDSSTHQLVFRGTAADQLSNNSNKNVKKDEKAVDKILNKLPKHVG